MSIGIYYPANSLIHRLSPSKKLGFLLVISPCLWLFDDWRIMGMLFIAVLILYRAASIPTNMIIRQLKSCLLFGAIIFSIQFYLMSWQLALLVVFRFLTLVMVANLVTLTTTMLAMMNMLERRLHWLKYLHINPLSVTLSLSLALRFIPVIASTVHKVREAQRARGLERSVIAVAIPVIIRTLKAAEQVSEAIECRNIE